MGFIARNKNSLFKKSFSLLSFHPDQSGLPLCYSFCLLIFVASCSEAFEPFQKNDRFFFSIYGYLDASADTQWVRVAPVREEFNMVPELPEMTVTLENLESGESVIMNDSLFQFRQEFNALNVWSEIVLEPDQTYRLRAENPNGDASEVTVTLPRDFSEPRLFIQQIPEQDPKYFLWIDGVKRLADVQSRWYIRIHTPYWEEKRMVVISLREDALLESDGSYTVQLFPDKEMDEIIRQSFALSHPDSDVDILHRQLFVAAGGPEWKKEISSMDDLVYSLPEGFSNVDQGLGYMVGIVSKLIPFESCRNENGGLIGCPQEKPFW